MWDWVITATLLAVLVPIGSGIGAKLIGGRILRKVQFDEQATAYFRLGERHILVLNRSGVNTNYPGPLSSVISSLLWHAWYESNRDDEPIDGPLSPRSRIGVLVIISVLLSPTTWITSTVSFFASLLRAIRRNSKISRKLLAVVESTGEYADDVGNTLAELEIDISVNSQTGSILKFSIKFRIRALLRSLLIALTHWF